MMEGERRVLLGLVDEEVGEHETTWDTSKIGGSPVSRSSPDTRLYPTSDLVRIVMFTIGLEGHGWLI